jgi:hypothetical protein
MVENVDQGKRAKKRDYPLIGLEKDGRVLQLVEAIGKLGSTDAHALAKEMDVKTGMGFYIASSKQYGLSKRQGMRQVLTEDGRAYYSASPEMRRSIILKALSKVPIYVWYVEKYECYDRIPKSTSLKEAFKKYPNMAAKDVDGAAGAFRTNLKVWDISFEELKTAIQKKETTITIKALNPTTVTELSLPNLNERVSSAVRITWAIAQIKSYTDKTNKAMLIETVDSIKKDAPNFNDLENELKLFDRISEFLDANALREYIEKHLVPAFLKDVSINNLPGFQSSSKQSKEVHD